MNAFDLFLLGRRLMKLGEDALPPSGYHRLPASARTVLTDVLTHPKTSIGEIVERTGFPQSLVSGAVSRLTTSGVFGTEADPSDRRRTLVIPVREVLQRAAEHASAPVEDGLAAALKIDDPDELSAVVSALEVLANVLLKAHRTTTTYATEVQR
jgi:DNA-binding MarR family transcriptional regulator